MNENTDLRTDFITGLRKLADFYEFHPDFPLPGYIPECLAYATTREDLARLARQLGHADKSVDDSYFNLRRSFGGGVRLRIYSTRSNVCQRVVVNKRHVPEAVVPAKAAEPETVIPAHDEEVVEWICDESILAPTEAGEAK